MPVFDNAFSIPGWGNSDKYYVSQRYGRDAMALNIKQLKQEGYTQTEIASMLGISQPTVSNYLRR